MKENLRLVAQVALVLGLVSVTGYSQASAQTPSSARQAPSTAAAMAPSSDRALLNRYCVRCHNDRLKTAGLLLDKANLEDVSEDPSTWEKVVRRLQAGTMPPAGRPRPDFSTTKGFVSRLTAALDDAALANPDPGRVGVHRLSRSEYTNAVRDLLAVDIDSRSMLPADDADQHGFDNMAAVLSISPALFERYMSAARRIAQVATGHHASGPAVATYRIPRMLYQNDRMGEDLPFGSRGGAAIRHRFPVDGEYSIKITLQGNLYDYIRGLGEPHQLEIRVDSALVKTFTVGGVDKGVTAPLSFAGAIFGSPEWEEYMQSADDELNFRVAVKAGARLVTVTFANDSRALPEGVLQARQVGYALAVDEMQDGLPSIETVEFGGPYEIAGPGDTPSRRRVLTCRPSGPADEERCAEKILSPLARRAFRRPVADHDVQPLLDVYRKARAQGQDFEGGIQIALRRLLIDPSFLFRIETSPVKPAANAVVPVSDLDLASRLSFFLWSSIPDDELLSLAERGKLREPAVLEQQVRRLLADPRAKKALVNNFAGQWLELRNVTQMAPDPAIFKEFDENLREAMRQETELFIEHQITEDKGVVEMLSADYTFLNERLAKHYGIPNVFGNRFRKVTLTGEAAQQRGGLLSHAGLLMVTAYTDRTSPVLRGRWLLENILGTPVPPPPLVPPLPNTGEGGKPATVRERLAVHRKNPTCSACHNQLDPLGFALENYDAIGGRRTVDEHGLAVDSSGVLVDGTKFTGLAELRAVLLERRELFVGTVIQKLLTYALGRGLEVSDFAAIRKIARDSAATDSRWSSIIQGIVKSVPFQMRRAES